MAEKRAYGAHRDFPDSRDLKFSDVPKVAMLATGHTTGAKQVDLEQWCGPVKNQRALGACTGFAASGLRELLYRKYHFLETQRDKVAPADLVLSPLYVYWWNRRNDGLLDFNDEVRYIDLDRGASIRSSMRTLRWQGACLEKEDPYEPNNFRLKPESLDCEEGLLFRTGAYHSLSGLDDIKSCLASGYPLVAAIDVYDSFESSEVMNTGVVPIPKSGEQLQGGHAILVIGYDDDKKLLKVRNSWGAAWGDRGNFYLPYDFVTLGFMNSMWMAHLGKAW